MANMSYCRFENTYSDLRDCVYALEDIKYDNGSISEREAEYAKKMRDLCEQYLELIDDLDCDDEEVD